jgi:Ca-activated chloride channel family protein
MNKLAYHFCAAALTLGLCGCEPAEENAGNAAAPAGTIDSSPAVQGVPEAPPLAPAEPAEPPPAYFALRPADNNWPSGMEGQPLSANLSAGNFYVILDGSGSMAGTECAQGKSKMEVAKQAVARFIEQIPAAANIGLFAFDQAGVSERVPLGANNRDSLDTHIKHLNPGGGTPLATAITYGYHALNKQAASQLGYGEYHLVVVTDGIASPNEDPSQIVQTALEQSPVMLHTVGFCINEQHPLNQPGLVGYTAANSPAELLQGLQGVLAEAQDFSADNF